MVRANKNYWMRQWRLHASQVRIMSGPITDIKKLRESNRRAAQYAGDGDLRDFVRVLRKVVRRCSP